MSSSSFSKKSTAILDDLANYLTPVDIDFKTKYRRLFAGIGLIMGVLILYLSSYFPFLNISLDDFRYLRVFNSNLAVNVILVIKLSIYSIFILSHHNY